MIAPVAGADLLTPRLDVLVVCPTGEVGGAERWLFRLLDATDRLQVRAVVLGSGPLAQQWRDRGVPVVEVPVGRGPLAVARAAARVRGPVAAARPDVVLANGVRAAAVAMPSSWVHGRPVVWVKHDHAFEGWLTRALSRSCAEIVAPSDAVGRNGTSATPVVVSAPRSRDAAWPRDRARSRLAALAAAADGTLPQHVPLLLVVGARIPLKGITDAVTAISRTHRWHLAVIGADDPAAPGHGHDLAVAARRLGATDRVHLLGPVEEAAPLMPGADVVALLTRRAGPGPDREGYGMTVLEAACAAVPVVCTPCPAASDLLAAGADAGVTVVPPGDPGAVADALRELSDPTIRHRAGVDVSRASERHPSTEELSDLLASTLAACAQRAGAGVPRQRGRPVSVVAPLFSEGAHAGALVRSVCRQLRDGDELVAVDDASPDDTADHVLAAAAEVGGRVRLVRRATNGGVGAARNSGVRAARHDLVVFADAGTRPAPGWLDAMRAASTSTPTPGLLAGGYTVSRHGSWQAAVASACYPGPESASGRTPWRRAWHRAFGLRLEGSAPAGRSLAISRSAWEAIGGFDERRRAAEDVDAGRAVASAGHPCLLVTDARVEWDQAQTWRGTVAMYRHYGRGDAQAEHRRAVLRDLARAAAYPLALVALAPGTAARPRRVALGAAALAYASVPLARASTEPRPVRVSALVPLALALKDLAKAWGALEVLTGRAR